MRTMKELAREALDVQDACNLSGVVHSFSRLMTDLRSNLEHDKDFSTDKLNRHPIAFLYANKIASLTGHSSIETDFSEHYGACLELAK